MDVVHAYQPHVSVGILAILRLYSTYRPNANKEAVSFALDQ